MKKLLIFILCVALVGCTTAHIYTREQVNAMTDEQIIQIFPTANEDLRTWFRDELISRDPQWAEKVPQEVVERSIVIGLTKEQVGMSWGKPTDINKTVSTWGVREQWVYRKFRKTYYLYFENGVLKSWQETKA